MTKSNWRLVSGFAGSILVVAWMTGAAQAASCPAGKVLASGLTTLQTGTSTAAGITVTFVKPNGTTPKPLPAPCDVSGSYVVVLTQSNDGGYSPTTNCTYLNVLNKNRNGFEIQHKECASGTPQDVTTNLQLGWVAIGVTQPPNGH